MTGPRDSEDNASVTGRKQTVRPSPVATAAAAFHVVHVDVHARPDVRCRNPDRLSVFYDDVPFLDVPGGELVTERNPLGYAHRDPSTLHLERGVRAGLKGLHHRCHVVGRLSVLDNLLLGAYAIDSKDEILKSLETVFGLFPILKQRQGQRADTFSGGEQQQLAIARGLMSNPSLLMFDEPSLGLSPKLVGEVFKVVKTINEKGVTVLLVEQNVYVALEISHRAYVLQTGRIVMEGKGQDLLGSDLVCQTFLGM